MVLRSECERYGCNISQVGYNTRERRSTSVTPESVPKLRHNYVHHHHHHHQQHTVHNHQKNAFSSSETHKQQQQQQKFAEKSTSTDLKTRATTRKAEVKLATEAHSYSDYSSDHEDNDSISGSDKTDYTYAKSGSYNSRITPTRHCPSPNMSRSGLRNYSGSNNSMMSSEESNLTESWHTDFQQDASLAKKLFMDQKSTRKDIYSEKTSFSYDKTSYTMYSKDSFITSAASSVFSLFTTISNFIYKYISLMLSVDTFILSSVRKTPSLLLLLLIPFLGWFLWTSSLVPLSAWSPVPAGVYTWFSAKSSEIIATGTSYEAHQMQTLMEMNVKMQRDLEAKWAEQAKAMESRWQEYTQQMRDWQGSLLGGIKDISVPLKVVSQEVEQLRTQIDNQISKEQAMATSVDEDVRKVTERLIQLEEKQRLLEKLFLTLEKCCKDQALLPVGVTQDDLNAQLLALAQEVRANISKISGTSSEGGVMGDVHQHSETIHLTHNGNSSHYLPTLGEVEQLVKSALDRYDADKTGLVDYALESAGGSVISTRCTESYPLGTAQFSLFGVPVWYSANTPRTVIQPQVHPGECWAMRGTQGYLVIQLSASIKPTAFSLEHIPRNLSPTGKIDSAPKEFSVLGLQSEKDTDGQHLGRYTFLDNGEPLQKFTAQENQGAIFSFIELRVHSNHGNSEYTCLYRFRVHGVRQ